MFLPEMNGIYKKLIFCVASLSPSAAQIDVSSEERHHPWQETYTHKHAVNSKSLNKLHFY
jgi:hypothetical protein